MIMILEKLDRERRGTREIFIYLTIIKFKKKYWITFCWNLSSELYKFFF